MSAFRVMSGGPDGWGTCVRFRNRFALRLCKSPRGKAADAHHALVVHLSLTSANYLIFSGLRASYAVPLRTVLPVLFRTQEKPRSISTRFSTAPVLASLPRTQS